MAVRVHKEILQFQWPLKWPDANWIRERWVSAPIALLVGGLSEGADEALELSLFTSIEVYELQSKISSRDPAD